MSELKWRQHRKHCGCAVARMLRVKELEGDKERLEAVITRQQQSFDAALSWKKQAEAQLGVAVKLLHWQHKYLWEEHEAGMWARSYTEAKANNFDKEREKREHARHVEKRGWETDTLSCFYCKCLNTVHNFLASLTEKGATDTTDCERVSVCCGAKSKYADGCGSDVPTAWKCKHHGCPWPEKEGECPMASPFHQCDSLDEAREKGCEICLTRIP